MIAYLTSRYFGLRPYSRIYGTYYAVYSLGGGIGPVLTAHGVAQAGGYDAVLLAAGRAAGRRSGTAGDVQAIPGLERAPGSASRRDCQSSMMQSAATSPCAHHRPLQLGITPRSSQVCPAVSRLT